MNWHCTISFNVTDIQSNHLNLWSRFKLHILCLYVWLTDVVRALLLCVPALLVQWSGSLIWKKIRGINICLPQQNDWIATLWTGVGSSWPIQTGGHISFPLTDMLKVYVIVWGGADKSLARPTSRCTTELIVSLERGVCSCAELQVFSCYRGWKEACQATCAISTTWRCELS